MPDDKTEGMPGTWSHCGSKKPHGPHRQRIVVNEGPYDNILCLGFPGDPEGSVPPIPIGYPTPDQEDQFTIALSRADGGWYAMCEFGIEAEDSDMVGGAVYATGATAEQVLSDLGRQLDEGVL